MWSVIASYIPKWTIFFQAFLLFFVPVVMLMFSKWFHKSINSSFSLKPNIPSSPVREDSVSPDASLTGLYDTDITSVRQAIGDNADVEIREFTIRGTRTRAVVVYVDGLLDSDLIDTHLIRPLMLEGVPETEHDNFNDSSDAIKAYISSQMLPVCEIKHVRQLLDLVQAVLAGTPCLLVDGMQGAFLVGSAKGKSRNVEEPLSEALLRGPRIGFTERLSDNTGLLRLHGKNESLQLTRFEVGNRVKKDLVVAYMKDIADPNLVDEVVTRIRKIEIDDPLESGYIEQLIEENVMSPFQQIQNTERPDRVIGALLEGRVAILLDGTPYALIVPVTFSMLLQSPEDYYERWISGSFVRLLRFLSALLALLAPALYISFISFNPGLIPTKLALTIIGTRQGVPFPSIIEALIMEIAIEILREAGIRLPKPIGPAMGIVGGLIIGDAAVNAGIVSPFLVIVVAVTAISSFTIPVYSAGITLRVLRFTAMFFAAVLGLFGVVMFFLLLCSHLVRLKSFGVPYASPMVPYGINDLKDFLIRFPLKVMKKRPQLLKPQDPDRRN
ncbi:MULTISPECIES: spore germination protein [Bacillales]|uniref:spore germination protein n=1 Tax=Bacillales TaxID=1385 RepID=UPI00017890BB|nr:spore germination protein [Paenibacillus sp. Y412MC10]ACX68332.1 GerA spore germination protein [Paenibacillus sp. Y412MC10]